MTTRRLTPRTAQSDGPFTEQTCFPVLDKQVCPVIPVDNWLTHVLRVGGRGHCVLPAHGVSGRRRGQGQNIRHLNASLPDRMQVRHSFSAAASSGRRL